MNSKAVIVLLLAIVSSGFALKREEIFARAVGPCIADQCQSRHTCYFGQCIPEGIAPAMPTMDKNDSIGPCLNSMCPGDAFCHQGNCYNL